MGLKRCKLSRKVQLRLLEFFVLEVTARSAADVLNLQANTVALFYRKVRELIVEQATRNEDLLGGEVEVDESHFGGIRKGKRGRGALGKVPVFGLLKRGGKVYVVPIPDAEAFVIGDAGLQESHGADGLLVREDIREGRA